MSSPLEAFRKHQRILMVALTALAMIAFIFLDNVGSGGQLSPGMLVFLMAMLCGGGLWFVGASRGKGTEWGSIGAILGAVVGVVSFYSAGPPAVATTTVRSFSRPDLLQLQARRALANRFVYSAVQKAGIDLRRDVGFGDGSDPALVEHALRLREAHDQGIHLADSAVVDFINGLTEQKLSKPDYRAVLRDVNLSEGDLFNILREELEARLVTRLTSPPYGSGGQLPVTQTPEQYWQYFRRMTVKESITAVSLPVEEFVGQVPEPREPELVAFFDLHKNTIGEPGRPGFRIPDRVQLAYLVGSFEQFEGKVGEPTAEEIAEFYEKNRDRYRVRAIPETPATPTGTPDPADAGAPANSNTEAPAAPTETPATPAEPEKPAETAPEAPAAPEPEKPETEKPATETPPEDELEPQCGEEPAAETASPATPETQPAEPAPAAATETPAAPAQPETPTTPAQEPAAPAEPTTPGLPALPPLPGAATPAVKPAEPQFRALDDDLKSEIRDQILRERAFQKMGDAIDLAYQKMSDLSTGFLGLDDKELAAAHAEAAKQLKQLATEQNLEYVETALLTGEQLSSGESDPIGAAVDGAQPSNPFATASLVAEEVFRSTQTYIPRRAERIGERRYAYWKIADEAPRVPEFKDSGVREAVVAAWKLEKARPLAEKRAKELADLARKSSGELEIVLAGQTVTGAADGPALSFLNPPKFSWMSQAQNVPQQSFMPTQPPSISTVLGFKPVGQDFMQTVFAALSPGETGVAADAIRSTFYVVRVKDRDGAGTAADAAVASEALQQQFLNEGRTGADGRPAALFGFPQFGMPSPYSIISFDAQRVIEDVRRREFEKKYGLTFAQAQPELVDE